MKSIVITISVFIIIFILVLILYISTNIKNDNINLIYSRLPADKYLLSDIIDKLKTGDVLLFRTAIGSNTVVFNPSIMYKHVAFIYKENDKLYTLEMCTNVVFGLNSSGKLLEHNKGLNIIPLIPRLNQYVGLIVWLQLNKNLSKKQLDILEYLRENRFNKLIFPSYFNLYLSYIHNIDIESNIMTCYSFIYFLLSELKLIDKSKLRLIDKISFINNLHNYTLYDSYKYKQKGQILLNIYIKDNRLIML